MRHSFSAIVAVTAIALAGCGGNKGNNTANKAAPANTTNSAAAAPAPAAPAPAAGGAAVDAAMLTSGPWAPGGACSEATTFNADGTITDNDGPGTWTLQGNTLTVTQKGQAQPATVTRNGDTIVAANPANPAQSMTITRCPPGSGGAPAGAAAEEAEGAEAEGEQ